MIRLLSRLYLANSYWRRSNCCPRNTTPSPWRSNMAAHGRHSILSSMPLQVLFYLNSWYFSAFFIAEILMFIYKGILLPYPQANLILDIVLLLLYLGLEALRLFYGSKGNLCERSLMLIVSVGVLVPCTVLSVYYLLLQTFILRLEFILNAILLCFYALELVLALITIAVFSRASVY
ncbi:transmembrane protein 216 isoform X1 [Tachysurus fulvidraco]|uniref:transmembrane protein 216 isoform X1 n=2 Tax=Tachysurus fulvidraco TaxID=1234273 RepID=UPI001FEF2DD2|nr:transmembrane protein 216 isoform X1 [Tachysurus fulvidraco]